MKTVYSDAGVLGPFQVIEVLEDRLRCDGVEYQFDLLGHYTIEDGSPPPPPPPPPPVPDSVPMLNLHLAMHTAGWLQAWYAYLGTLTGDAYALLDIRWTRSITVRRADQWFIDAATALSKSSADIDQLFIAAGALNP